MGETKEVAWESIPVLSLVAKGLRSRSRWNPLAPLPAVGGKPALHAVEPLNNPCGWISVNASGIHWCSAPPVSARHAWPSC